VRRGVASGTSIPDSKHTLAQPNERPQRRVNNTVGKRGKVSQHPSPEQSGYTLSMIGKEKFWRKRRTGKRKQQKMEEEKRRLELFTNAS